MGTHAGQQLGHSCSVDDVLMRSRLAGVPFMKRSDYLLINGDCRKVIDLLPQKSISYICVDPPYSKSCTMQTGRSDSLIHKEIPYENLSFSDDEWTNLIRSGFRVMKDGGRQFIFCNQTLQMQVESVVQRNRSEWGMRKLVWRHKKGGPLSTDSLYSVSYTEKAVVEYVLCIHRVGKFKNSSILSRPNGIVYEDWLGEYSSPFASPDVKPMQLYCDILKRYKTGIVLDYCMHRAASGSASLSCGHFFVGVEKRNEIFKDAVRRMRSDAPECQLRRHSFNVKFEADVCFKTQVRKRKGRD